MDISRLKPPFLAEVACVYRFQPVPDMETYVRDLDKLFSAYCGDKQIQLTKVPNDSPPDVPRLVIIGSSEAIEISLVHLLYRKNNVGHKSKANTDKCLKDIADIKSHLSTIPSITYCQFESHVRIRYPDKDTSINLSETLSKEVTGKDSKSNLTRFTVEYDEKLNSLNKTTRIGTYTIRRMTYKHNNANPQSFVQIPIESMRIIEVGLDLFYKFSTGDIFQPGGSHIEFNNIIASLRKELEGNEQFRLRL